MPFNNFASTGLSNHCDGVTLADATNDVLPLTYGASSMLKRMLLSHSTHPYPFIRSRHPLALLFCVKIGHEAISLHNESNALMIACNSMAISNVFRALSLKGVLPRGQGRRPFAQHCPLATVTCVNVLRQGPQKKQVA